MPTSVDVVVVRMYLLKYYCSYKHSPLAITLAVGVLGKGQEHFWRHAGPREKVCYFACELFVNCSLCRQWTAARSHKGRLAISGQMETARLCVETPPRQEEKKAMSQSKAQSLTLLIGRPSIARTVAPTVDAVSAADTIEIKNKGQRSLPFL